jgi:hypothetical protein
MSSEEQMAIVMLPGETKSQTCARAVMDPSTAGVATAAKFRKGFAQDLDLSSQVHELKRQVKQLAEGDLTRADEMLLAQAHTLDAVFNNLLTRAWRNLEGGYFDAGQAYFTQAFKAQNQCRTVWEAISRIKHPPIRQTNIAHNQQINNMEKPQSKLMDGEGHERVDETAKRAAIPANSPLATLEAIHRTEDGAGEAPCCSKFIQGGGQNTTAGASENPEKQSNANRGVG